MKIATYQFQNIFDNSPAAVILKPNPPEFTIVYANIEYLKLAGKSLEALIGKGLFNVFAGNPEEATTDENIQRVSQSLIECTDTKRTTYITNQRYDVFQANCGQFVARYYDAVNKVLLDEDGKLEFILHSPIDITDLYDARKKREESENKFRNMLLQAPVAMLVTAGQDMILEEVNPAMLEIIGKDNSIIGRSLLEEMPELEGQAVIDLLKNVYRTGAGWQGQEQAVQIESDGKLKWRYFNISFTPIFEENQVRRILQTAVEVTELVESRRKIQESEERLNLAVDNALAGIYDTNLITGESIRSLRHAQIFGYKDNLEKWSLENLFDHILPADQHMFKKELEKTLVSGSINVSVRIRRLDGEIRWINIIGKISYNDKYEPQRILGTTTDITEKKSLERQKDEFVSTVSHELKTPVTSIKAYAQFLHRSLKGEENVKNRSFLERMDNQINRLENLIKDLLDVTRVESGKLQLKNVKFEMNIMLAEVISDLQLITSTHKLIITENKPVTAYADKERIVQVITNLVTNAVKYSPLADKVFIALTVQNNMITCSIKDFGIGIPLDQQPHVFDRYHQATNHNPDAGLGLGLGLYISKEIIIKEGGNIWFESKAGEGSCFYFSLPCC